MAAFTAETKEAAAGLYQFPGGPAMALDAVSLTGPEQIERFREFRHQVACSFLNFVISKPLR